MVHSGLCGPWTTVDRLARAGLSTQVTGRAFVPWGPVLRSRRTWLEERGLAHENEEREELVIIRASH